MKRPYLCIKDWNLENVLFFKSGNYYFGRPYNQGNSVEFCAKKGMLCNFHKGSEYFSIKGS